MRAGRLEKRVHELLLPEGDSVERERVLHVAGVACCGTAGLYWEL